MVGELTNRPMARFNAAGLRTDLDSVMHILCSLKAVGRNNDLSIAMKEER